MPGRIQDETEEFIMKKNQKRILSIALTLVMVLGMIGTAFATGGSYDPGQGSGTIGEDPVINYVPTPAAPTVTVKNLNTTDHMAYVVGKGENTFDPMGSVTRAEAATMYFRLLLDDFRTKYWDNQCSFADVADNAWYNVAVATLENAGVIKDTAAGGNFRPNEPITRAELAVMAAQFAAVTGTIPTGTFTDVPSTHWAAKEIAIVQYAGWIEGYQGKYRPEDSITRAESVTIINRMLKRGAEAENMLTGMVTFTDNTANQWFYEAVQEAANSHTYTRTSKLLEGEKFFGESWKALEEAPNWAELEKTWAQGN